MAKYDDILEEIKKRQQYANAELNTAQDVINYAQNNGKSYQRLNEEYQESVQKTKQAKNWMDTTAKKGNIALSNNYQAPTAQSMLSKNISKKPWEKLNKPTTDVGIRVQQERDELERQQDYYNKKIANSEQYKDYMNRTNKINPILEYSKNVAQVREQGLSGADKAFAPLLSGLDNIRDLGGSFVQSNGTRVMLPSLNDIKTQKAIEDTDNWLYKGYADVTQSIGNMLPGIALNAIPGAGTALGTAYFAASTYGSARNQALLDGYDEKQATTYGIINSALEIGLGKVLGGASALLGKSPASKWISKNVTSKIAKNPVLSGYISDMVSEFGEEYLQEYLDPIVQAYVFDHKEDLQDYKLENNFFKLFEGQNFYAGLLGAISAGITNAPNSIKQNINVKNQFENIVETIEQEGNQKLTEEQKQTLKDSFYNEYNKAVKNKTELNYNDVVNNANIQANTNVETNTEENILSNIEELKAKQKETKDVKEKQEIATKISELEQQVEEMQKKVNLPNNNISVSDNLLTKFKKLFKSSFDENGNIKNFKTQVLDFINKKTPSGEQLLVKPNSQSLSYANLNDQPIVYSQKDLSKSLTGKHSEQVPRSVIDNLPTELDNSVLAMDSRTHDNAKVFILNSKNKDGVPLIATIHQNRNVAEIEVNALTSVYEKNDIQDFINNTAKGNKNIYTNNKTNEWLFREGLQLPKRFANSLVSNINIPQTNENVNNGISQYNMPNSKKNIPLAKEQDVLKIDASKIAQEMNGINKSSSSDENQRRWVGTSTESDVLKDKILIKDLDPEKINYVVESNKKSVDTANNYLDVNGYEKALSHVKELLTSDTLPKASDVALAERVLQEAVKNGDTKTAQDLLMDIAILGTDLGQATQALSIIKKLTPEGQLRMYTKIIQRAKSRGEKAFKDVEITTDMVQNVLDAYNFDGTYDQKDLNNRVEQFKQQIADQMKTTKGEKINAWRYLSMLGNPKTHIRNIVSNVAMNGTIKVKNAMARTLETIIPVKNRTKTWKQATDYIKNYSKQTANDMKDIITGENKYNEKSSLESKKQIFKSKTLEKLANFNSNALEAEDWFFSKRAFQSTLQEYLTANGINTESDIKNNPEIVEKAKNYAVEQAEIATFRQYSKLASQINNLEKNNKIARLAIEATVPFKKTPINVAKAGVKYSPLGLIKSISYDAYQVAHGNMEASQLIDNLSQGMTGTSLALLGYALAKAGILNGAGGDDKDDKYDSQLGDNQYSLKIGDKSYSISWLSPVAMPLLVGANAYEQLEEKEEWDMNVVSETLAKTLDPLNEMSFMSGLTNALTSYGSGVDKIKGSLESVGQNYVGQFFPTLFSQIASTLDDKKRSTKASANSSYKFGEQTLRSIMYKIPGLRQNLEVATDIWGNEKEQADNIIQRAYESFLAPYSATKKITSDLDKEIKNIYNKTGETGVIPSVPYSYVKYKDNTYRMSAEEYTKYKKTFGQNANKYLNNLINSSAYKNASDNDKAKMINNTYDYAKAEANEEYFKSQKIDYASDTLKELNDLKKIGINDKSLADYISNKTLSSTISGDKTLTANEKHQKIANNLLKTNLNDKQLAYLYGKYYSTDEKLNNLITLNIPIKEFIKLNSQDIESDYNKNTGATISGSKKQKIINYINSLNLSVAQKAILIKSQYNTFNNYNNEIVNYVNNLNKTANDKKVLLKSFGFDDYDKDVINYINSLKLTAKEKETKLKSLGFTIRDGRVYSKWEMIYLKQ